MTTLERHDGFSDREAFFELATDLACIGDLEGKIIDVNAAWTEALGWTREELLSRTFLEFVHPEDRRATFAHLRSHKKMAPPESFENRFQAKDGSYHWLSWRSKVSITHQRVFAVARDVTQARETERERERLAQLVASSHDAITAATLELIVTDWNAAAERLYGYKREEIVGRSVLILHPDDCRDEVSEIRARVLRGEPIDYFRTERVHRDGHRIPVSIAFSPIRDHDGNVVGLSSCGRDLRPRLAEEAEAREQREALSNTLDAILFMDRESRVISANRAAAELIGLPAGQALGRICREAVHDEDLPVYDRIHQIACAAGKASAELRIVRTDGTQLHVWVALVASYLPTGHIRGFHLFLRDVSERKALEARILVADRMASIGTLAAGVAHEINNPLAYMLSNLGFVKAELARLVKTAADGDRALFEELQDALKDAVEGGERVRGIVQDLRTFTRGDTGTLARVSLRDAAEMALKMASPSIRERAALRVDLRGNPEVMGNEGRLTQVLLNLLVNASQAIAPGAIERNSVSMVLEQRGRRVVVECTDTGAGIPESIRRRIFDPFFTTKPAGIGTGLGLSICHQLVSAMGGELTFESAVGKGTTFRVVLPVAEPPEDEVPADADGADEAASATRTRAA